MSAMLRAVEPYLRQIRGQLLSPWKGNLVMQRDLREIIVPWGFVPQGSVREQVSPARAEGEMDARASRLNLDIDEFLEGAVSAYLRLTQLFTLRGGDGEEETGGWGTDFSKLEVASPDLSRFLNDVLRSYEMRSLVPRLEVRDVEARLCNVGVRHGGVSKNRHFLGMMSDDELRYHLTMGMVGPEGVMINDYEWRGPKKIIADVELRCREAFVLEDGEGNEVLRDEEVEGGGGAPWQVRYHYLTFQSDLGARDGKGVGEEGEGGGGGSGSRGGLEWSPLEWQVANINDAIKPNLDYYFSRFGH